MTREQAKELWDILEAALTNGDVKHGDVLDVPLTYDQICDLQNLLNQVE